MNAQRFILCSLIALTLAHTAWADGISSLNKTMAYQEVKTWHEQLLRGEPTNAQRLDAMRSIVSTSRLGERGLNRIFRNFEGNYSIDPRIAGVEKSVLLQRSSSQSQAKGYRRELLYASAFHNDPRFGLEAMNRVLKRSWGNTDADLVIRHKTGLYGRIEVKDYSLNSQITNLKDLKIQIDKMAKEGRSTGQPQFWINRREVLPEIRQYASGNGINVLGNVSTGRTSINNTMSAKEALDQVDQQFIKTARTRATLGGGLSGYGTGILMYSAPAAWDDLQIALNSGTSSTQAWLRFGENGSSTLAGGGMLLSGGSLMASRYASEGLQAKLYSLGRTGGIYSPIIHGLSEVFLVSRYVNGDVSSREFWTTQWVLGSSLTGGTVGGLGGGFLGSITPIPVATEFGATVGSFGGTWAGEKVGQLTASKYYESKFGKLDQEFGKFVYSRYGVK